MQTGVPSHRSQDHNASSVSEGPRAPSVLEAEAAQQIAGQRALGHYRELHTIGTMHPHPPSLRNGKLRDQNLGRRDKTQNRENKGVKLKADPAPRDIESRIIGPLGSSTPQIPSRENSKMRRQITPKVKKRNNHQKMTKMK